MLAFRIHFEKEIDPFILEVPPLILPQVCCALRLLVVLLQACLNICFGCCEPCLLWLLGFQFCYSKHVHRFYYDYIARWR